MILQRLLIAFAFAGLALAVRPAEAAYIIDQSNPATNYSISSGVSPSDTYSFGQSFTPTMASINFVTLTMYVEKAASYRLVLLSGDGTTGPIIGASAATDLPISNYGTVEFDFATPVTLIPNSVYTFRLQRVSGSNGSINARLSDGDTYKRGYFYASVGTGPVTGFGSDLDLAFTEGIATAAVPEPATLAMVGLGLVGVGVVARRGV